MGEEAQDKVQTMQEYLAMGDEYRATAVEELKRKWREKLKRAHDAVLESKALYDKSSQQVLEYKSQIEELMAKCKEATDENEHLQGEIQALVVRSPPRPAPSTFPTSASVQSQKVSSASADICSVDLGCRKKTNRRSRKLRNSRSSKILLTELRRKT
jgi:hypothetical protein